MLYVTDEYNYSIRKITPAGVVTTLAGGTNRSYRNGSAGTAKFSLPHSISIGGSGVLYVVDLDFDAVRMVCDSPREAPESISGDRGRP